MAHDHTHHAHHHHHAATGNIAVAFFVNLGFAIVELAGGLWTNSIAILSDAFHDFGDSLSLGLAWYFQKLAKRGKNRAYSYGYKRFSLIGAVVNSIVLVVGSIFILAEALPRLAVPEATHTEGMFLLAIIGVLVNGAAVFRLQRGHSINERVVSLHLLEDVLGWLAILVGAVVMHFCDLPVIDPILSIAIACFVLFNVFRNIRQTLRIILQGTPEDVDLERISTRLQELPGIEDVHDLHAWSMDGEYNVLTLHVTLHEARTMAELAALKATIRGILEKEHVQHATIEFETADEACQCQC